MSDTAALAGRRRVRRGLNQKAAVCVVLAAASFMSGIDSTIVNVAVPTLGRDFHARPAGVDAVVIGYLVSLAVLIPASGWLGDRIGGRRVMLAAVAAFTGASALCGAAGGLGELVLFRILQGASAGLMGPVGLTMVLRAFPPAERARVSGILVLPSSFVPVLGPVLGGVFVTSLSWRWAFYVNVPLGIGALVFGLLFLDEQERRDPGSFDALGFVLACAGLGSLMYGLSEGPGAGWRSPGVVVTLAGGVLLLAVLTWAELRRCQPLIDVRLVSDRLFRTSSGVMFLTAAGYGGALYLVSLLFQYGMGLSALKSGLNTLPEALGVVIAAPLMTRRLYPAIGPRRLITGGLAAAAAGMALMSLVGAHTPLWRVWLVLFGMGFSMQAVFAPVQTVAFTAISQARLGRASAFFNAQRQAASAIGVALLTTVISSVGVTAATVGHASAHLAGYHAAFLAAAGLALLGSLTAAAIKDEDAAPTVVRARLWALGLWVLGLWAL